MMRIAKHVIAALMVSALIAGVSGCKKKGPMEQAGEKIDKAAEKTGQQLDKAVKKTGENLEKAGDKIKNSVK
jgi:predicted small lipoprotein YifL